MAPAQPRRDHRRAPDGAGVYIWFHKQQGWPWWKSLLATLGLVVVFRGLVDLIFRS